MYANLEVVLSRAHMDYGRRLFEFHVNIEVILSPFHMRFNMRSL